MILSAPFAQARIGESKDDIEKRMNSRSNGAYQYPEEEALREALELPYKSLFVLQPLGSANSFYFKRSDDTPTSNAETFNQRDLDGWEVHYCYFGGNSVLEFYRRHGDPMTIEELEGLMKLMLTDKPAGTHWVKSDYVPFSRRWDVELDENGIPHSVKLGLDGKVVKMNSETPLREILPQRPERLIYLEIPEDVKRDKHFGRSLIGQIWEDEQRATHEAYNKRVENEKKFSASRTERGKTNQSKGSTKSVSEKNSSSRKAVVPFNSNPFGKGFEKDFVTMKDGATTSVSILRFAIEDIYFGENPIQNRTKEISMHTRIPLQPKTFVGYNYELSDGSMRALIYDNAILFMDSSYDERIRDYMETLYEKQSRKRKYKAEQSLSKF